MSSFFIILKFKHAHLKSTVYGHKQANTIIPQCVSKLRNGQRLVKLVWACDLIVGNELPECRGRWTWECGEKRSVMDYILLSRGVRVQRMVIEDEGETELGSDHYLIGCVVRHEKAEKVTQEERYKWKVDGRQDWEDYQQAVQELGVF